MTGMEAALKAAAAALDPDRPQDWTCRVHARGCPRLDKAVSRTFYDTVIEAVRKVQTWRDVPTGDPGFVQWVERERARCDPVPDRELATWQAGRERANEATIEAAERARQWLADHPSTAQEEDHHA